MNWLKAGGLVLIILGLIAFVTYTVLGWSSLMEIRAIQLTLLKEQWPLLAGMFLGMFGGTLLLGLSD